MFKSQAARDAQTQNFGTPDYWQYLDQQAQEHYNHYIRKGDPQTAQKMLTRSLAESLQGNNGE